MDLVAYLRILRRHWRLIVIATVIGAVIGAASTLLQKETTQKSRTYYKATHTLFLDAAGSGEFRPVFSNLDQIAVFVLTGDVPQQVADAIGGDPDELVTHIFTTTNGTLQTIDITAADANPRQAEDLADTFADKLTAAILEKEQARFDQQRDETLARLDDLQSKIAALDALIATRPPDVVLRTAERDSLVNAYRTTYERFQGIASQGDAYTNLSTIQDAEAQEITKGEYDVRLTRGRLGENQVRADTITPDTVIATNSSSSERLDSPFARGLLGALLGLLVGVGLSLVVDRVDRRLRTREDFETAFGMPVLAEMPILKAAEQRGFELTSSVAPFSRATEAYRAIRSSLLFQRPITTGQAGAQALTIMIASANPKEGKSTTAANLATIFAESGLRVLAVNCDFRRPTLHRYFDATNEPRRVLDSGIEGLMIVSDVAGPENPSPAYIIDQQRRLIQTSRERFDVVVLDTAPLLSTNDATELIDLADLVVLVGRVGVSTSDSAHRTRELLSRLDAPAAGVVMVGSEAATNDYYYYYSRTRAKQLDNQAGVGVSNGNGSDSSGPKTSKAKRRSGKS
jgi:capsular exopolysaccharide synthesis family protein